MGSYEVFGAAPVAPERLWALVGEPRRLPEWTDVRTVLGVEPEPLAVGSRIGVRLDRAALELVVTTLEPRLLEVTTHVDGRHLGLGVRVVRERGAGSRIVLAGRVGAQGPLEHVRVALLDGPALRRRFDRWIAAALRRAASEPSPGPEEGTV